MPSAEYDFTLPPFKGLTAAEADLARLAIILTEGIKTKDKSRECSGECNLKLIVPISSSLIFGTTCSVVCPFPLPPIVVRGWLRIASSYLARRVAWRVHSLYTKLTHKHTTKHTTYALLPSVPTPLVDPLTLWETMCQPPFTPVLIVGVREPDLGRGTTSRYEGVNTKMVAERALSPVVTRQQSNNPPIRLTLRRNERSCLPMVQAVFGVLSNIPEVFTPIGKAQRKDPELSNLIQSCKDKSSPDHLKLINGSLLIRPTHRASWKVYVPLNLARMIFAYYHESPGFPSVGFAGAAGVYHLVELPVTRTKERESKQNCSLKHVTVARRVDTFPFPIWGRQRCQYYSLTRRKPSRLSQWSPAATKMLNYASLGRLRCRGSVGSYCPSPLTSSFSYIEHGNVGEKSNLNMIVSGNVSYVNVI
uniref:Uncharacterized protein n=1 Tax=Timema cristinae TaxID=61476 RepID=A0A7R9HBA1_TIMCR|nr:unnamed protein product [Timema cristinae]